METQINQSQITPKPQSWSYSACHYTCRRRSCICAWNLYVKDQHYLEEYATFVELFSFDSTCNPNRLQLLDPTQPQTPRLCDCSIPNFLHYPAQPWCPESNLWLQCRRWSRWFPCCTSSRPPFLSSTSAQNNLLGELQSQHCWWKWRRREGATELWKSSEVHLNLFLMIQTQEWTESVADAPFIHFFGSNDVTWSFCWSTLLIFQSNTLWQSKWK